MAINVGDAVWTIDGDRRPLNRSLDQAERDISRTFDAAAHRVGAAFAIAGTAISGIFAKAANDAADFGVKVANLATLGVKDLQALEEGTRDLAAKFGIDLNDAIAATYETLSAGIPEDAALMVMEQAARGAQAGVGSLGDALDLGTSVMNAWNVQGKNAVETTATMEKIMGMAATAAFKGKTTFAQMAQSIGQVAPVTAAAGVSIEEFFAALAGLTATGLPTSSAMAQLQQMISNVIKPSGQAAQLAQDLGLEFNAEALAAKGLTGFLDSVKQATGGNVEQMGILFGSVEALGAAISLTGNQAKLFKDTLGEMGKAQETLTTMSDAYVANNPALAFEQMKSSVQSLFIEVGQYLLPAMVKTAKMVNVVIESIINWMRTNPELATQLLTIAKNIGFALIVVGGIIAALPTVIALFAALSWPVTLAGVALGAIVGAFALAVYAVHEWLTAWMAVPENMSMVTTAFETAKAVMASIWEGIVTIFRAAVDGIKGIFTRLSEVVSANWSGIAVTFGSAGEWIVWALGMLASGIGMAFEWIGGILVAAVSWTMENWGQLVQIWTNAKDGLLLVGGMLWEGLKLAFNLLWEFLSRIFGEIGEGWTDVAGVASDESATWLDVIQKLQEKTLYILGELSKAFERFTDFVYWIWPIISTAMEIGANLFIEPIFNIVDWFFWGLEKISWIANQLGSIWDGMFGGSGFSGNINIGGAPGLATGGTVQQSGWAVVGEMGPELLKLPRGATVYDNQQTQQALSGGGAGGGQTYNVTLQFGKDAVRSTDDIREIERGITRIFSNGLQTAGVRML